MKITPDTLLKIRSIRGLTQYHIAGLCGVSETYITLIEKKRRPMPERISRLIIEALALTQGDVDRIVALYDLLQTERN